MILIDTSAWIDFFRGADPVAVAVDSALSLNEAAFCGPIEAELRRGFVTARERNKVLPLLAACHRLDPPADLWSEAGDLGFALRRRGVTAKTFDLLVAIYALSHAAILLTSDRDFRAIEQAGVPLQLAFS